MSSQDAISGQCYKQLRSLLASSDENGTGIAYKPEAAAGFIVGAGPAARDAVPAMHALGLSPIFILHYDSGEMYQLLNEFLHINLQGLRTPGMAQRELDDLAEKRTQIILGVSTIPSTPPTTPREEYVYNIAKLILEQSYQPTQTEAEHLRLPERRCLADMHNGPEALLMQDEAKASDWSISAIKSSTGSGHGPAQIGADKDSAYWWQFKQKVAVA